MLILTSTAARLHTDVLPPKELQFTHNGRKSNPLANDFNKFLRTNSVQEPSCRVFQRMVLSFLSLFKFFRDRELSVILNAQSYSPAIFKK